jgi:hypothetical protein
MARIGRPKVDFEQWKEFIHDLLETPSTWPNNWRAVKREMNRDFCEKTLRRQCATWGFVRQQSINRSQLVVLFIKERYQTTRDNDREIARLLEIAGVVISADHVACIRIENNLLRREPSLDIRELRQQAVTEAVRQAYVQSSVREYGREMMWTHLQRKGVVATRSVLYF